MRFPTWRRPLHGHGYARAASIGWRSSSRAPGIDAPVARRDPPWPIEPDRDGHAVHAALEECFADHWDPVSVPYDQWRRSHLEGDAFDPRLWILATDGDEIAGVAACRRRYGRGFVDELGVRRAWRGRGLGLALLRLAFAEFWRRDERSIALSVDSENLTGATALYERAGMQVEFEMTIYRKDLA